MLEVSLEGSKKDCGVGHFLQAPCSFDSLVLVGPGGEERPGVGHGNLVGAGEHYVEEVWRRQRVVREEACIAGWGGDDDGQHSVFCFVCLLQMMKWQLATAAPSITLL